MGHALGGIVGGGLSLLGASQASRQQRAALGPQRSLARQQAALFREAQPYYGQVLQYLAGNAGLPVPGAAAGGGSPAAGGGPGLPPGAGSIPESALGVYGTNPADRYRFAQAEDELGNLRRLQASRLAYQLGQQGAGSNTIAAALARNEQGATDQLSQFRRQLAINAGAEQERRVGGLLSALSPGFGAGPAAAGIYGQQAAQAGSQLGQAGAGIGQALQNYMLYRVLSRQRQQPAGIGGEEMDPLGLMRLLYSTPGVGG